jgi:glutathione S-transferase
MSIVLYDLCGANDARFSPYCWRVKMALAHKGLPFDARPTPFTAIPAIADGTQKTVPVIEDNGRIVRDSFDIAVYLEETYPDRPSLFGGPGGISGARFIENWSRVVVHMGLTGLIVADVHSALQDVDDHYFRESREKRLGRTLEEAQSDRDTRLEAFRAGLAPARMTLDQQPFLGGHEPLFTDFILFGALQWARATSTLRVLAEDDPVRVWFERCLDLYGGLGRAQPARAA